MRRVLLPLPARGPAPPPAPGLHDRRAEPDLAADAYAESPSASRPITPQLAWRVAVLGGIAFVLFGIVFFRLWFLQVLSGEQARLRRRARTACARCRIEAPRGDIVDRNGVKLVTTKVAAVVQIVPNVAAGERARRRPTTTARRWPWREGARLTARRPAATRSSASCDDDGAQGRPRPRSASCTCCAARRAPATPVPIPALPPPRTKLAKVYRRLGARDRTSRRRPSTSARCIRGIADAPYSNVTIQHRRRRAPSSTTCASTPELFPGVVVEKRFLRKYPHDELGRPAVRHGRPRSPSARAQAERSTRASPRARGSARAGSRRATTGTCAARDGYTRVVVNALGSARRPGAHGRASRARAGRAAQADARLRPARRRATTRSRAAIAAVAVRRQGRRLRGDGPDATASILAMGSQPGFDANIFAKPFSQKTYDYLTSDATGAPLLDRATESGYPTGSTFKPVTALAAMAGGHHHAEHDDQRHRPLQARHAGVPERQGRAVRPAATCRTR